MRMIGALARWTLKLCSVCEDQRFTAVLLLFCLSFAVRTVLLFQLPRTEQQYRAEAEQIGLSLASKGTFSDPYRVPTGPTAHCAPFYPLVVAGIYRVFGTEYAGGMARCFLLISAYSLLYAFFPSIAAGLGMPRSAGFLAGLISGAYPLKRSAEVFRGWE